MKSRPNTDKFKLNPASFLEAAAGNVADQMPPPAPAAAPPAKERAKTEQKGFRLRLETIANIEREIYARSVRGERTTQTELVEQALASFFASH